MIEQPRSEHHGSAVPLSVRHPICCSGGGVLALKKRLETLPQPLRPRFGPVNGERFPDRQASLGAQPTPSLSGVVPASSIHS